MGATCILRSDNERVPELDRLVATKGYKDPPIEEWPGSLMGMEEIAAAWGDPRDWFDPYHRLNEAASLPGGSGPPAIQTVLHPSG